MSFLIQRPNQRTTLEGVRALELIGFWFLSISTRKVQMSVDMTSVLRKKDQRTHPKRNEQSETTTLATKIIFVKSSFHEF